MFSKNQKAWRHCILSGRPGSLETPGSHGGLGKSCMTKKQGGLRGLVKFGEMSGQSGIKGFVKVLWALKPILC